MWWLASQGPAVCCMLTMLLGFHHSSGGYIHVYIQGVEPTPPSRRSLVKGAAWAVPAVVAAAAAPALAASPLCLTATFAGKPASSRVTRNNYGYRLNICFTNPVQLQHHDYRRPGCANTGDAIVRPVNDGPIALLVPNATEHSVCPTGRPWGSIYTTEGMVGTSVNRVLSSRTASTTARHPIAGSRTSRSRAVCSSAHPAQGNSLRHPRRAPDCPILTHAWHGSTPSCRPPSMCRGQ